ncbi:MAG: hypothetical protein O7C75_11775, partial [Verrucomicrobia bacterium]|nr:hypothetical protein [Verrucomicrobiota bacterium]
VLTKEMFEDTGATDAQSILSYALGTEVAGPQGNFAGGNDGIGSQQAEQDNIRTNPQQGQRVRGLAIAQLTRNYFETDIGFDIYNTDRITINRGPNSLLFGIGSAGGVINNSPKQARISRDFGEIGIRFGERGSHRETIDYNKVLVDGRLAVRFAALNENFDFKQRPAFEDKERFYVALNAVLFENEDSNVLGATTFRANLEDGSMNSTPPNVIPPGDGISSWFSTPDPALQQLTGSTFPGWISDGSFVPKFTLDGINRDEDGIPRGIREADDIIGSVGIPHFISLTLHYSDISGAAPNIPGTELNGGTARAIRGFGGRPRRTMETYATNSFFAQPYFPAFRTASLPTSVLDNRNLLITGNTNRVEHDFDAKNFVLEQSFFENRAGIELAYDSQTFSTFKRLPFSGGANGSVGRVGWGDIRVDINQFNSNDEPNPNLGRPIMNAAPNSGRSVTANLETLTERESKRATAFYDLDFTDSDRFGWLGRHIITGVLSSQERDIKSKGIQGHWETTELDFMGPDYHFAFGGTAFGFRQGRTSVRAGAYLGPSLLDSSIQSIEDVKFTEAMNIPLPQPGDTYRMYTYNRTEDRIDTANFTLQHHLQSGDRNLREIDTEILSVQSYLLGGNLVGLVGWRTDEQTNTPRAGFTSLPTGSLDPATVLELGDPLTPESGNTFTWSLVGHLPENIDLPAGMDLSAHYNQSENFNPVGLRSNILGDPLPSPNGTTEEFGFTVGVLENRVSARFNWYTTSIDNDRADLSADAANPQFLISEFLQRFGDSQLNGLTIDDALAVSGAENIGLYNSFEEIFADIINLVPPEVQQVYNYRWGGGGGDSDDRELVNNPTPIRSFVAEGFELDIVGNITDNWRVFVNAAKQETVQLNIAKEQLELANYIGERIRTAKFKDLNDTPWTGGGITFLGRFNSDVLVPLLGGTLQEGTVSLELREWRVNMGTNYLFNSGPLNGVGLGGALRWQSEVATGYPLTLNEIGIPVPVLSKPFFGPDELNGDVWVSYSKKILDDKIDWKIQLNVRNAFGDSDNIPVVTNPDGKLAIFRNPLPTEVFLSNTFRF